MLLFLSTLSLRRATNRGHHSRCGSFDFYPRSPCGERLHRVGIILLIVRFLSTLSLRRATPKIMINGEANKFLSTLSLRRATVPLHLFYSGICISIHALLAESDASRRAISAKSGAFLSTLSLRRATCNFWNESSVLRLFLSTLSLRRATVGRCTGSRWTYDFYPRSPCGERPDCTRQPHERGQISIHALLAESDIGLSYDGLIASAFLSTLSLRRATVAPVLAVGRA